MINLKMSKKETKALYGSPSEVPELPEEEYPYGTRLDFKQVLIKKIKALQGIKAGTKVKVSAIGKVIEVRTVDSETRNESGNVEIQLQKIDGKNMDDAKASFDED